MRRKIWAGVVAALLMTSPCDAAGASSKAEPQITAEAVKQAIEKTANSVELITFPDTRWSPVRVVRGETDHAVGVPGQPRPADVMNMQVVTFADPRDRPVSIFRGWPPHNVNSDLFGPASIDDLDRVAFAVDGAESSHGADLRMWRPEPSGPQGPMQVTAAAAIDVGGGDRFDIAANRALGRAYLARMYVRYGNWPDAIAAYNWGPGNLDAWIGGGRTVDKLPLEVERYRHRVLREAGFSASGAAMWPFRTAASRVPTGERPTPASAAAVAFIIDAVERTSAGSHAAIQKIVRAVRARAADWKSAYSALGDRILPRTERSSQAAGGLKAEYAASAAPAD